MLFAQNTMVELMQDVADYSIDCQVVVMETPKADTHRRLADRHGIELWFEAFSDRAYDDHGRLASRHLPGAVHTTTEAIEAQVRQIVEQGTVTTLGGHRIPIKADTICIHGDSEHAVAAARHIREVVGS